MIKLDKAYEIDHTFNQYLLRKPIGNTMLTIQSPTETYSFDIGVCSNRLFIEEVPCIISESQRCIVFYSREKIWKEKSLPSIGPFQLKFLEYKNSKFYFIVSGVYIITIKDLESMHYKRAKNYYPSPNIRIQNQGLEHRYQKRRTLDPPGFYKFGMQRFCDTK